MQPGLVTYNVAQAWDLDTILRICRETGLQAVEFRTTHKHGVEPALTQQQRAEVRAKLAQSRLGQVSLGSICEFQSPDQAEVERQIETCRSFIQLAHDIGARAVKVRPNGMNAGSELAPTLERIGTALRRCGRIGADLGIEIWMEVHGGITQLPANAHQIMEVCGDKNVGLTWNSNSTDVANGSVAAAYTLLKPYVRCCHINDLWSAYPYRELFGLLRRDGFAGYTLCEVGHSITPDDGATFLHCYHGLWDQLQKT